MDSDSIINISVIMPVYNGGRFLEQTIESVIAQTYKDFELIAVNDGSTDNSLEILNKYKESLNLNIINKKNAGVSAARNDGIKAAKGCYICFLDADDYLYPDYLASLYNAVLSKKADIACCEFGTFYSIDSLKFNNEKQSGALDITSKYGEGTFDYLMSIGIGISVYTKMIKKDIIIENNILFNTNSTYGEDMFFCWKAILLSHKTVYIQRKLYGYRMNDNGATCKYHKNLFETYQNEYESLLSFGRDNNLNINALQFSIYRNLIDRIPSFLRMNVRSPQSIIEKYKYVRNLRENDMILSAIESSNFAPRNKNKMINDFINEKYFKVLVVSYMLDLKIKFGRFVKNICKIV